MKLINLTQNTPEWLEFRRKHIGASDAATIMGINPYRTSKALWREKVLGDQQKENSAMRWGKEKESEALRCFETMTHSLVFPAVVLHPEIDWASASLDGLDIERNFIVEIKCPGAKNHQLAVDGFVPDHYYAQIQHQLACCDLDDAFYFSYDGNKGVMIEVKRNKDFIEKMIDKEEIFWDSIKAFLTEV